MKNKWISDWIVLIIVVVIIVLAIRHAKGAVIQSPRALSQQQNKPMSLVPLAIAMPKTVIDTNVVPGTNAPAVTNLVVSFSTVFGDWYEIYGTANLQYSTGTIGTNSTNLLFAGWHYKTNFQALSNSAIFNWPIAKDSDRWIKVYHYSR